MKSVIDTDILRLKLSRARLCKDVTTTKYIDPPNENPEGLQYLIDNVLSPLMNGQKVHSLDLDFTKIDENNIEELGEYYTKYFSHCSRNWNQLKGVYDTCNQASSLPVPVSFI